MCLHMHSIRRLTGIGSHREVARVLIHARSRLADARVGDEVNLDAGIGMLEDGVLDAITLFKRALVFPCAFSRERSDE